MTRPLRLSRRLSPRVAGPLAGLLLATALVAPARADIAATDDRYEALDPGSITFQLRSSGDPLESAVLSYKVLNPDGNVGGDVRAEIPPGGSTVDLAATLTTNGRSAGTDTYIPVGSMISYSWTLTAEGGERTTTPEQTFVFLDGRYRWNELAGDDGVTVYWYDNEADAQQALSATSEAITDVEALLRVDLDFPVRVVVYARESEGELAQRSRGSTFDSQIITGGSRVSPDVLHIYDGLGSFEDIARHEAAHLVTRVAGDGPFTRIPSWLDEGVAVFAQRDPGGGYRTALDFSIRTDSTLRVRNMNAPANRPELINQFYGQSWAIVKFLVDSYGEESLAELFAAIKAGQTVDGALTDVYGLDQDSAYNAWRESVGLPPIEYEPVVEATRAPGAEATRAPLMLPTSVAASGGSSASGGTAGEGAGEGEAGAEAEAVERGDPNAMMALIIGGVAVMLALLLGGLGFRMLRSKA